MNKVNKTEKDFDTVKFFREVKTKIAKETCLCPQIEIEKLSLHIDKPPRTTNFGLNQP